MAVPSVSVVKPKQLHRAGDQSCLEIAAYISSRFNARTDG